MDRSSVNNAWEPSFEDALPVFTEGSKMPLTSDMELQESAEQAKSCESNDEGCARGLTGDRHREMTILTGTQNNKLWKCDVVYMAQEWVKLFTTSKTSFGCHKNVELIVKLNNP
jgi:hypothetical protein